MPIRNPFARRPVPILVNNDENARPDGTSPNPGFERVDTVGSKASSALSIGSGKSDNGAYKLSVVNDSGVYLPPSPTEQHNEPWPRRYLSSRTSTDTRSSSGEIEHFSISRESFDSYRRSFDISARSPIPNYDQAPRQSLDSRMPRLPRASLQGDRIAQRELPTPEEDEFEDVGLNEEQTNANAKSNPSQLQQQKKRGFFSKFGSESQEPSTVSRFHMPGRRRAHSQSQGSELGVMEKPRVEVDASKA